MPALAQSPEGASALLAVAFHVSPKAMLDQTWAGGLVALRSATEGTDGRDVEHTVIVRLVHDKLVADLDPTLGTERGAEIAKALGTRLDVARQILEAAESTAPHRWILSELIAELEEFPRTDRGTDARAFRVSSRDGSRAVYVHLYASDVISFELEDFSQSMQRQDPPAVAGRVDSLRKLRGLAEQWLNSASLPRERDDSEAP